MPAAWKFFTICLNSVICCPRSPLAEYVDSGARNAIVL